MNSVNLSGRMTKDPELRRTDSGKAVCSFNLAVKRPRVADKTDFVPCVVWQQGAEYLTKYGRKGDVVAINGCLASREWADRDGNKRTAWEVVAESVELLGGKKNDTASQDAPAQQDFGMLEGDDAQLPF